MTILRPLRPDEFPAYSAYFIPDYALDLVANQGLSPDQARSEAAADLQVSFPGGLPGADQTLLCIENAEGQHLGYLWYESQANGKTAFVQDFHIFKAYQGFGHAKSAMAAFETLCEAKGFAQMRLRVSPENAVALHVYKSSGFRICGIQMVKPLPPAKVTPDDTAA